MGEMGERREMGTTEVVTTNILPIFPIFPISPISPIFPIFPILPIPLLNPLIAGGQIPRERGSFPPASLASPDALKSRQMGATKPPPVAPEAKGRLSSLPTQTAVDN